jgi:hypothetical protein
MNPPKDQQSQTQKIGDRAFDDVDPDSIPPGERVYVHPARFIKIRHECRFCGKEIAWTETRSKKKFPVRPLSLTAEDIFILNQGLYPLYDSVRHIPHFRDCESQRAKAYTEKRHQKQKDPEKEERRSRAERKLARIAEILALFAAPHNWIYHEQSGRWVWIGPAPPTEIASGNARLRIDAKAKPKEFERAVAGGADRPRIGKG